MTGSMAPIDTLEKHVPRFEASFGFRHKVGKQGLPSERGERGLSNNHREKKRVEHCERLERECETDNQWTQTTRPHALLLDGNASASVSDLRDQKRIRRKEDTVDIAEGAAPPSPAEKRSSYQQSPRVGTVVLGDNHSQNVKEGPANPGCLEDLIRLAPHLLRDEPTGSERE